jgi:hypothetical protein
MRSSTRSFAALAALVAALIAVSSLFNIAANSTMASSHREAPLISSDPLADNTDLYAFVSPDKPDTVTIVANFYPGEAPAGGPNFYKFGDDVAYDIHIDNVGDAKAHITYRFNFSTAVQNPNTFLYATGPIESLDSKNWNIRQSYSITKIDATGKATKLAFEGRVPPVNIGPTTTPNYDKLASAAIGTVEGMKVYAGQRDDPFWVDLGGIFDTLTIRKLPGNAGGGIDALKGMNVQSIVMQIPIKDLTSGGDAPTDPKAADAVIGIWSTTSRFATTVINPDGTRKGSGDLVQVSRLGNPLVNEVVVPVGAKDLFNASQPKDDKQFLNGVLHPELGGLLNALYKVNVPTGDRTDLVAVYLTGVPGLNQPPNVVPSEELRLNVAIPPAKTENHLGVLGGDLAGFPNGRRLGDEVVDISLQAVAGVLYCTFNKDQCPNGDVYNVAPNNQLGGGVKGNDVPFLKEFPYVALPHAGFDQGVSTKKSAQPAATPATSAQVTVTLNELNGSGMSGTATLTAVGDKQTRVVITATGATAGDHPAHIHAGTCDTLNPNPLFPLNNVDANGHSDTTIDVALSQLTGGGFAINVHKSAQEIGVYVMCGNIGG